MTDNHYSIDDTITISIAFTTNPGNAPVDPAAVTLYLIDPTGALSQQVWPGGNVVQDSTGNFHYELLGSVSGWWSYQWQGVGNGVNATSEATDLYVEPSRLIAG